MKILMIIALFLLIGCGGTFQKEIVISREEIQEMVNAKFPYDKNALVARLTLHDPQIYFVENNIGMRLEFKGNWLEKEIKGYVAFDGKIAYRRGAFYLEEFNVTEFAETNVNSDTERLRGILANVVNNYISKHPVYKLNPRDFKQNLAKILLRDVFVRGSDLVAVVGI